MQPRFGVLPAIGLCAAALTALSASGAAAAPAPQQGLGTVLHELLPGIFPGERRARSRRHRAPRHKASLRLPPLPAPRPASLGHAEATAAPPATTPSTPETASIPALPLARPPALAAAAPPAEPAPPVATPMPPAAAPAPPVASVPVPEARPRLALRQASPAPLRPLMPSAPLLPAYDAACAALAQRTEIAYQPAPPIERGRCIAPAPVKVSAVRLAGGGTVALEPAAVMRCAMALALARWVRDAVAPAAHDKLKAPLSGLRIADSYSCRTRDHLADAKLSEHGRANAVDIGAFRVGEGRWIAVNDAEAAAFLVTVRDRGCTYFNTVLGPGSDRWHADNLHLDLEPRGPHRDSKYCH